MGNLTLRNLPKVNNKWQYQGLNPEKLSPYLYTQSCIISLWDEDQNDNELASSYLSHNMRS